MYQLKFTYKTSKFQNLLINVVSDYQLISWVPTDVDKGDLTTNDICAVCHWIVDCKNREREQLVSRCQVLGENYSREIRQQRADCWRAEKRLTLGCLFNWRYPQ